ncbi:MAG TPA: hypothetical protein VK943_18275 [Arenibaculum sp.]|nr:hypothetical protein [Arenibaculum sp.]
MAENDKRKPDRPPDRPKDDRAAERGDRPGEAVGNLVGDLSGPEGGMGGAGTGGLGIDAGAERPGQPADRKKKPDKASDTGQAGGKGGKE